MQRDLLIRLKSRKFLMALANFLFVVLNEVAGTPVDREAYFAVTGGIIAFIAGESYIDGQATDK
ncbi:hypothetical protein [Desulforamulus reducens]|uniref:hypothetical protein n=1 Tax=Desulforamulus reducens TaxID=59610 RepID=UPI000302AA44|nr:hypothetical protein [Desulforamulus reducens]